MDNLDIKKQCLVKELSKAMKEIAERQQKELELRKDLVAVKKKWVDWKMYYHQQKCDNCGESVFRKRILAESNQPNSPVAKVEVSEQKQPIKEEAPGKENNSPLMKRRQAGAAEESNNNKKETKKKKIGTHIATSTTTVKTVGGRKVSSPVKVRKTDSIGKDQVGVATSSSSKGQVAVMVQQSPSRRRTSSRRSVASAEKEEVASSPRSTPTKGLAPKEDAASSRMQRSPSAPHNLRRNSTASTPPSTPTAKRSLTGTLVKSSPGSTPKQVVRNLIKG